MECRLASARGRSSEGGFLFPAGSEALPHTGPTSGRAHDDLEAAARRNMSGSTLGRIALGAAYAPASLLARGADSVAGAARYADDALHGRLGTDLTDLDTVRRMVFGAVDVADLMGGAGIPMAERGAAGIFGGRLAATADHAAADRAERMLAAGAPRDDVLRDTGWFRGADGAMRYEIPDDRAVLSPRALQPGVADARLGDVLHHPDLYAAYPEAADLRFRNVARPGDEGNDASFVRSYGGRPGSVFLVPTIGPEAARLRVLHEAQHYVQNVEGMNPGAKHDGFRDTLPSVAAVRDARLMSALLGEGVEPAEADAVFSIMHGRAPHGSALGLAQQLGPEGVARLPSGRAAEAMRDGAYLRNMGEVEARNVDARADMGAGQRAAAAPWSTQDVSDARQLRGTGGIDPCYDGPGGGPRRADNVARGRNAAAGAVPPGSLRERRA